MPHKKLEAFKTYVAGEGFLSAQTIVNTEYPQSEWLIKGWVSRGELVVLAGRPKTGKSVITTQMCIAVATGQPFLERFETRQGRVLVYDLDDRAPQRLQDRLVDFGVSELRQEGTYCTIIRSNQVQRVSHTSGAT